MATGRLRRHTGGMGQFVSWPRSAVNQRHQHGGTCCICDQKCGGGHIGQGNQGGLRDFSSSVTPFDSRTFRYASKHSTPCSFDTGAIRIRQSGGMVNDGE